MLSLLGALQVFRIDASEQFMTGSTYVFACYDGPRLRGTSGGST